MKRFFAQLAAFFFGTFIAIGFRSDFDSRHAISIGDLLWGALWGGGIAASIVGAFFKDGTTPQTRVNPELIKDLQQGNDQQRRAASYKLGNSNDPKAVTALISAYNDTDSLVRRNVIDGLRAIGTKEALDFLNSHNLLSTDTLADSANIKLATKVPTDDPNLVLCSNCGYKNFKGNTKCSQCIAQFTEEIIQKEQKTATESNKLTEEIQQDVTSPKKSADEWCDEGNSLASKGQYNEAIVCLEEALHIDPKHALSWFNMGLTLMNLEKKPEAVKAFNTFIEYAPPQAQTTHVPVAKGYIQMLSQLSGESFTPSPQSASAHTNTYTTLEPEKKKSSSQKVKIIASIVLGILGCILGCWGILSLSAPPDPSIDSESLRIGIIFLCFVPAFFLLLISIGLGIWAARGRQVPK